MILLETAVARWSLGGPYADLNDDAEWSLIALGCSAGPDPDLPPEIRYGEDVCHSCNMIIKEPRFAAANYTAARLLRFEEVLANYAAAQGAHDSGGGQHEGSKEGRDPGY